MMEPHVPLMPLGIEPPPFDDMTSAEVANALAWILYPKDKKRRSTTRQGIRQMLAMVEGQPGATWQQRWYAADGDLLLRKRITTTSSKAPSLHARECRNRGLRALVVAGVIRPGIACTAFSQVIAVLRPAVEAMYPEDFERALSAASQVSQLTPRATVMLRTGLAAMVLFTGKPLVEITPPEWVAAEAIRSEVYRSFGNRSPAGLSARSNALDADGAIVRGKSGFFEIITLHRGYSACVSANLIAPDPYPASGKPRVPATLRMALKPTFTIDFLLDRYGNAIPPRVRAMVHQALLIEGSAYDRSTLKGYVIRFNSFMRALTYCDPEHDSLQIDFSLANRALEHLQSSDALLRPPGTKRVDVSGTLYSARTIWDICHDVVHQHNLEEFEDLLGAFPFSHSVLRQLSKNERRRREARIAAEVRRQVLHLDLIVQAAEQFLREADEIAHLAANTPLDGTFEHNGTTYRRSRRPRRQTGTGRMPISIRVDGTNHYWDPHVAAFHKARTHVAMSVLRETGIRIEELVEVTIDAFQPMPDGDRSFPVLHVVPSKMDRARTVGFAPELLTVILDFVKRTKRLYGQFPNSPRYDSLEETYIEPQPLLLFHFAHQQFTGVEPNLVRTWIQALGYRYDDDINPSAIKVGKIRPHGVRRMYATDLHDRGATLTAIQNQLGHANLHTTDVYVKPDVRQSIASVVRSLNTRDKRSARHNQPPEPPGEAPAPGRSPHEPQP